MGNRVWPGEPNAGYPVNRAKSFCGHFVTAWGTTAAQRRASRHGDAAVHEAEDWIHRHCRGEVRNYLCDNARFWLNKYRLDGLRFDSVVNIRNVNGRNNDPAGDLADGWGLLQRINNEVRASQPWKITIAEDLQNNEWITKETGAGGAGFGTQWDAGFVHPIRNAVITADDANRDMLAVSDALYHRYNDNACGRVIYTESHDEVANGHSRVPEEIWPGNAGSWFSRKRSTLGAAMAFTAPGIPMIFQGQEFLEDGYFQDTVPLDWAKLQSFNGIYLLYRDLIHLRRNWANGTRGLRGQHINVHHINNTDKVIAFHRWENGGPGDDVVVVANFANRSYDSYALGLPREGQWRVRFNSDWQGYSADFGNQLGYDTTAGGGPLDNMPYQANVGIGPYSVLILSQDNSGDCRAAETLQATAVKLLTTRVSIKRFYPAMVHFSSNLRAI